MADDPPQELRPGFWTGTGVPSFFLNYPNVGFQSPADPGPGPVYPKIATLTDAFPSTVDAKWTIGGSTTAPSVSGGQLHIPIPNPADSAIWTTNLWDLEDSELVVEFAQVPDNVAAAMFLRLDTSFFNFGFHAIWTNNNLILREKTAGTDDTTITYDPVAHRWIRIRESGGTVFWDTAPDGVTWTNQKSKVTTLNPSAVTAILHVTSSAVSRDAIYDNINLAPAAGGVPLARPGRRALRPVTARRGLQAARVPAQVVAAPAAYAPESRRRGPRAIMARWRRGNATRIPWAFPKTATLTDAFPSTIDAKWDIVGTSTVPSVSGGQLHIPIPVSTDELIHSHDLYDLTDSYVLVEFAQVPDAAATSATMELRVDTSFFNSGFYMLWTNGNLLMRHRIGAANDDTTIAYDAVSHRWLRIRASGSSIFWDTAPDGVTWTNRKSKVTTLDPSSVTVILYATSGADSSRDAIFDNVNLSPVFSLLAGGRRVVRPPMARRRGRTEAVPTQAVVASPPAKVSDAKRAIRRFAFLPRRDRSVEVVPPQTVVAPPATSRRTVGRIVTRRRGRVEVVPPQIVVTPPAYAPDTRRRITRGFASRRRRSVEVVPPQIVVTPPTYAPDTRRRITRGFASRRRRSVEVVPPQIVVTPPAYAPDTRRRITRGFASRRRRSVEVVPPQIVVAPPAKVSDTRRNVRRIVLLPRRDRSVEVTPPQAVAAAPRYVPTVSPKRALRGVPRRGRRADVPPAQAPAPRVQGRRPLRGLVRRVGRALGVIGSGAPTAPLVAQVILTAEIYPRTLTASLDDGVSRFDAPAAHVLTAETYPRTLTAPIIE